MNRNGRNTILNLRGLIYFENFHFVSWVIDTDGEIWYNDGRSMGCISVIDGTLISLSNDQIWKRETKILVGVIYAQGWHIVIPTTKMCWKAEHPLVINIFHIGYNMYFSECLAYLFKYCILPHIKFQFGFRCWKWVNYNWGFVFMDVKVGRKHIRLHHMTQSVTFRDKSSFHI